MKVTVGTLERALAEHDITSHRVQYGYECVCRCWFPNVFDARAHVAAALFAAIQEAEQPGAAAATERTK